MLPIRIVGKNKHGKTLGLFICPSCTSEWTTVISWVKLGRSKKCKKCAYRRIGQSTLKHGNARIGMTTPEYRSWVAMKSRCLYPSQPSFKNYGGRGISVCERWVKSFSDFLFDMGKKPSASHTLDRVDVNGNYSKENCRWATMPEQVKNQRKRKSTSIYNHVHFDRHSRGIKRWRIKRWIGGKLTSFGRFKTEEEAGKRAMEIFG